MNTTKIAGRIGYLDDLRVMAATAVIALHVSAKAWIAAEAGSWDWIGSAVFDNMACWCVNIFLMISGVLFLNPDRKVETKRILTVYIPRLVAAFFFWSAVYLTSKLDSITDIWELLFELCQGYFHQWYLFLMIGLYPLVPLLRRITEDKKTTEYFLLLTGIMGIVVPEAVELLQYLKLPMTVVLTRVLVHWEEELRFALVSIEMYYLVLGWYLHRYGLSKTVRSILWGLAIAAYGIRVFLCWQEGSIGAPISYSIGDLLITSSVFLLGWDLLSARSAENRINPLTKLISECSFGIYLVHMLVLNHLDALMDFFSITLTAWAAIPLKTSIVLLVSLGISWLLRKVPVLKRYVA